jgi:hypothetical protein
MYITDTIKVSLNHTLPITLCYSTHKIFKSHIKSSQADFLYSTVLLKLTTILLSTTAYLLTYSLTAHIFEIWSLRNTHHGHDSQKTHITWRYLLLCDVTAHAPVARTKNTASPIVACWTVFTELLSVNILSQSVTLFILFLYLLIYLRTYFDCQIILYTDKELDEITANLIKYFKRSHNLKSSNEIYIHKRNIWYRMT